MPYKNKEHKAENDKKYNQEGRKYDPEYSKKNYQKNRQSAIDKQWKYNIKKHYGITEKQYLEMLEVQGEKPAMP